MDRRTALKNISLSLGYTVAAPTVLGILQSCQTETASWIPQFFSEDEGYMIIKLSDIILPKTEIAGALDVNVPEFMDKMFNDVAPSDQQEKIKDGAKAFSAAFKKVNNKDASKGSSNQYQKILEKYFNVSESEKKEIFEVQKNPQNLKGEALNKYSIYKFLLTVREYTLFGYYTSEYVGENILSYDPIPGSWEPCIPAEDVGNAWAL